MGGDITTFDDAVMPRSTIKAFAKQVLKPDTIIQKDALVALTEGSTVFISYLTTHANDIALSKKRKTIMPADVFEALKTIEFERFVPELKEEYEAATSTSKDKRRQQQKMRQVPDSTHNANQHDADDQEDLPLSKRVRISETGNQVNTNGGRNSDDEDMEAPEADEEADEAELVEEDAEEEEEEEQEDDDDDDDEDEEEELEAEEEVEEGADAPRTRPDELAEEIEPTTIDEEDTYDEVLDNGEDSD